jgi:hypothetical protein
MPLSATSSFGDFFSMFLPKGFPRIRYFGWMANRRKRLLVLCRSLLHQPSPATDTSTNVAACSVRSCWLQNATALCASVPSSVWHQSHRISPGISSVKPTCELETRVARVLGGPADRLHRFISERTIRSSSQGDPSFAATPTLTFASRLSLIDDSLVFKNLEGSGPAAEVQIQLNLRSMVS